MVELKIGDDSRVHRYSIGRACSEPEVFGEGAVLAVETTEPYYFADNCLFFGEITEATLNLRLGQMAVRKICLMEPFRYSAPCLCVVKRSG
jgi:hypothetical protein